MNFNQTKYSESVEKLATSSVFAQPWWLGAMSGNENWDAIVGNDLAFAFHFKKKFLQKAILPSVLTPYQPIVKFDKKLFSQINQFDFVELFFKDFDSEIEHELLKNKFEISIKHTRVLDLTDLDNVYKKFKPSLKAQIRKAEKKLTIQSDNDLTTFYNISKQTFIEQNRAIPYTIEQLKQMDLVCKKHNASKFFIAYNALQEPCGAVYMAFDEGCAYYLCGGIATQHKSSAAMCLLLWQAIQFASTVSKQFDFCGSTIPSIDKFFSTFGAEKKEILVVNRYKNPLQRWMIKMIKK